MGAFGDWSGRLTYRDLAKGAAVSAAYFGSAKLGLSLAFATGSVTAIWPPTGIALAALVIWGRRFWPAVALGALAANSWTGVPWFTVAGITTGNTLEALAGAWLLGQVGFKPSLERVKDVLALAVLAGGISTMASATIGVASLWAGNEVEAGQLTSVWRVWWLGDMGGNLLVAPLLLVLALRRPLDRRDGRSSAEAALIAAVLTLTGLAVFSQDAPITYLAIPPLIWAALRFGHIGATAGSVLVAGIAVAFTAAEIGPFVSEDPDTSLLRAQTFMGVAGMTALLLATATSAQRRTEEQLRRKEQNQRFLAETLQRSLLPPSLPEIPGFEVAARFRAAGEGIEVGGDFYDLFRTGAGDWALVMGDVCGKGPEAAAVTAMARYTLRATTVHERRPGPVLSLLNEALRSHDLEDRFCTVIYGLLQPNGGSARLSLASGGHPLPMLLRADGRVEEAGEPGMLLGSFAEPPLPESAVELGSADSVIFYTDGVTEAGAPERIIDSTQLSAIVAESAGHRAEQIAAHIERSVLGAGQAPRDDIAILVLTMTGAPAGSGSSTQPAGSSASL